MKSAKHVYIAFLLIGLMLRTSDAAEVTEVFQANDFWPDSNVYAGSMALDSKSNLFFVASGHAILRLRPVGSVDVFTPLIITGNQYLYSIRFLTIDQDDNLYIGGELSKTVVTDPVVYAAFKITPTGDVQQIFHQQAAARGSDPGLLAISDSVVDQAGNLYISGYVTDNVLRVDAAGGITELMRGPELPGGLPFERPRSMRIDDGNNLYVAASRSANIIRLSPAGEIQKVYDGGDPRDPANQLMSPNPMSINAAGEIFAGSSSVDGKAILISPDGQVSQVMDQSGDGTGVITAGSGFGHWQDLEFTGEPLLGVGRTAAGPDGSFYITGGYTDNLFRIDREGKVVALLGRTATPDVNFSSPRDVLVSPFNEIYVSASGSRNILKIELENTTAPAVTITDTYNDFAVNATNPVFRFYNTRDNAFFYTSNAEEANTIISNSSPAIPGEDRWPYAFQGSTFSSAKTYPGAVPLHRFYNTQTGHHFFTVSQDERDNVMRQIRDAGWAFNYEGDAYRVYPGDPTSDYQGKEVPVFRFYSPTFNRHFFTADNAEAVSLLNDDDWHYEGIAFYGEFH
tara:strand:+ start:172971 stop:174677 length:1707 start_codon:yes stop_codon:yes gene_type:complete